MTLEMQQVRYKMGDGDQVNELQSGTVVEIDSDGNETSNDENKSTKSAPRVVFFVVLFNVFLIVAAIPVFLYIHTQNELLKKRILDFLIVGGAIVSIPVLYCMGDLSEGTPNFYYI